MTLSQNARSNWSSALQIWIIGALVPVAFFVTGDSSFRDFDLLWAAARLAISGDASSVYGGDITAVLQTGFDWGEGAIFPYPPHMLLLLMPFALLPRLAAYVAWDLATLALFYCAVRPYLPQGFPKLLALLTPASLTCLDFGQTGLLLGALWLLAFRGRWAAVALLTFKPHLGVLGALSIRSRADLFRVILLVLILVAVSAIVFAPAVWIGFIHQALGHGGRMGALERWMFAGVGPAMGYGLIGWVPFALAGGLILARKVNVFTASTASFLISPFGFHYDMTVCSLGFGLLIFAQWRNMPVYHRIPVALGFLAPVIAVGGAWWVPPILLWALWTQVKYPVPGAEAVQAGPGPVEEHHRPAAER